MLIRLDYRPRCVYGRWKKRLKFIRGPDERNNAVAMREERCDEANTQITGCSNKKNLHSCCLVALAVIKDAGFLVREQLVLYLYGFGVAPITEPESSCAAISRLKAMAGVELRRGQ
jgi:hypothetical protein